MEPKKPKAKEEIHTISWVLSTILTRQHAGRRNRCCGQDLQCPQHRSCNCWEKVSHARAQDKLHGIGERSRKRSWTQALRLCCKGGTLLRRHCPLPTRYRDTVANPGRERTDEQAITPTPALGCEPQLTRRGSLLLGGDEITEKGSRQCTHKGMTGSTD